MSLYVDRGGEQVLRAPFLHENVRLRIFGVSGDLRRNQEIADRYLNRISGGSPRYRACSSALLLTFADMPEIRSLDPRDGAYGFASELDVALWIPLERGPELVFFNPYIVVDNPYAAFIGREHYGFPKVLGRIDFPLEARDRRGHRVETLVLEKHAPSTHVEPRLLLEVLPDEGGASRPPPGQLRLALRQLRAALVQREVKLVFLRQLRDIAAPERAVFQEIVEAPARPVGLGSMRRVGGAYRLSLPHHDSHPVARELGLEREQTLAGALDVRFSFVMETGRSVKILQESPPERTAVAPGRERTRRRVAILGGGVGGLAAAFRLTEEPGWQQRYDVTVYQSGWRLGGKGASGRNADHHQRIEEHGLHVWFGFYQESFRMIRAVYRELDRPPTCPLATWLDAFQPQHEVTFHEPTAEGWSPWPVVFGANGESPGDAGDDEVLLRRLKRWATNGGKGAALLARSLGDEALQGWKGGGMRGGVAGAARGLRRSLALGRLVAVIARGAVGDRLFSRGFESIDDLDLREWLLKWGADAEIPDLPLVRSVYDLTLAFRGGRNDALDIAAGTALRGLLRILFDYQGAAVWRMTASMGDAVIAPLYEVLRRRGVRFAFFHHVDELIPGEDGQALESIRLSRQATILGGEYDPLVEVRGVPSWPDRPRYEQLQEGAALAASREDLEHPGPEAHAAARLELRRGRDFDAVILAIPVASLPAIAPRIIAQQPAWKAMIERVQTTATVGVQLWTKEDLQGLGYQSRGREPVLAGTLDLPLSTWADMTLTARWETWPPGEVPGHIAYFCGPLQDAGGDARAVAEEAARALVEEQLPALWPRFSRARLAGQGEDGFYLRVNTHPSERYVQSVKGSTRYRLPPGGSGISGLFLAGDWTRNAVNAGCAEGAVTSGLEAARCVVSYLAALGISRPEPVVLHDLSEHAGAP